MRLVRRVTLLPRAARSGSAAETNGCNKYPAKVCRRNETASESIAPLTRDVFEQEGGMDEHGHRSAPALAESREVTSVSCAQFESQLKDTLAACSSGRRSAPLHLGVARATDIR